MTRSVSRVKPRNTKAHNLNELRKLAQAHPSRAFRRKIGAKGAINRKHLIDAALGRYDFIFHATKGWRKRRRVGVL